MTSDLINPGNSDGFFAHLFPRVRAGEAEHEKELVGRVRDRTLTALELLQVAHSVRDMPRASRRAWRWLAEDPPFAWTSLGLLADSMGAELVRRSGRLETGFEGVQLGLRRSGGTLPGPVGVGDGQRQALHQAVLGLLSAVVRPGADFRESAPHAPAWSPATDLLERASLSSQPLPTPARVSSQQMSNADGARLLVGSFHAKQREAEAQHASAKAQALTAAGNLARAQAKLKSVKGSRTAVVRLREAAEQVQRERRALEESGLPEAERSAAGEALTRREEELEREALELFRLRMTQPAAADLLASGMAPGTVDWEFQREAQSVVAEVEGQRLWIGEIFGRHPDDRMPCDGTIAERGEDGWYQWRGPLRESQEAAREAAARLAWSELDDQRVPDPYAPGSWPGFLIPQKPVPVLADLVTGGALAGFLSHEEQTGDGFRVEMSGRSGLLLRASATGASAQEARGLCARRMLGLLAAESGFATVPWPANEVEGRLEELAREPWLTDVRRRSWAARGGGLLVEATCLVDGVLVRAQAVAEQEPVAVAAAVWLLAQRLGQGGMGPLLDTRPPSAAQALEGLRARGVVGAAEVVDGPGGAEAVVASAEFGRRRLWAAGEETEQALGGVLAAARCWAIAPGAAQELKVGEVRPGWGRRSWGGERIQDPQEVQRMLGQGARLCMVGVEDGRPGFILMPPAGSRVTVPSGGGQAWRVWTDRGPVRVPGPLLPVALLAQAVVGRERAPQWDQSVSAWAEILRLGCEAVAAGQVWPGARGDGSVVWRPGPWSDGQAEKLQQLTAALPPWAHSAAVGSGKGAIVSAGAAAGLVLVALADELVRGPGAAAVWGPSAVTSSRGGPAEAVVGQWLDAVEEIADALPPPGVVLSVQPPPKPRMQASSLKVQIRLRPAGRGSKLVTLPELHKQLGAEHPAVLRALRALRKAAGCWPVLTPAVQERADQVRVSPGEASLLLGHLGRALRRAGIEVEWPRQWARRLRPVIVAAGPQALLSMQELVDYRWQIRLDGIVLSAEECVRIADAAGTLVWLRDRWVLVDAVTAERARGGRVGRAVPAGEALTALLLGSVSVGEDEIADVVAEGPLGDLAALLSGDAFAAVEAPRALAGELWHYQREGLTWLANVTTRFGALLCDDMGLGKSVQAIALIVHRREKGLSQGLPVLVVVPSSMMLTWVRQFERFAPTVPVRMYHGTGRTMDGLETDTVVVTSYGTLLSSQDELATHTYSLVVADEAQHVKNPSSKTFRALAGLLALARIALTGTPVENRLSDLWALLHWTNPALFTSQSSFQQQFGALETGPDPEVAAALNRLVGRFLLRRHKSDPHVALQLPERIDSVHTLALTPTQAGLYTRTVQMAMEQLRTARGSERAGLVLRLLTHLRQICNAPAHLRIGAADSGRLQAALAAYQPHRDGRDSCKLAALDELVPSIIDGGESMVVFTEFRTMAALLHRHAADWGVQPLLHVGGMSSGERDASLDAFRRRKSRLLIVTYGAGGTGLDLTAANHAVLFDRPFNPARVAQAIDRLHRPGQLADVHVHQPTVAGTVEDKIEQLLSRKTGLLKAIGTGTALNPALLTDEELHALVALGAT
ncbi:SNF2-related protein [Streptomyces sp. NPDC055089]